LLYDRNMAEHTIYPHTKNFGEEIYHAYSSDLTAKYKKFKLKIGLAKFFLKASKITAVAGVILLIISFAPSVWYFIKSADIEKISQLLGQSISHKKLVPQSIVSKTYEPRFDPKLPMESRIKIPSIGVDSQIQEATLDNLESALKKGVWRVSDFGTPADRAKTTILAAHRFGYLAWSNLYRRKNSFFNLPKLKVGQTVELIWKQRKYVYEIYGESKGEEISDYSANLILYTCEALNSPVRIFKYARLLQI
jgi:sortase (surface protein transpeptidase)